MINLKRTVNLVCPQTNTEKHSSVIYYEKGNIYRNERTDPEGN